MNIINNVALCRVNKHWFIISSINKTNIKVFLVENVMRNSLFFSQMKTFNLNCISEEKSVSNGFFLFTKIRVGKFQMQSIFSLYCFRRCHLSIIIMHCSKIEIILPTFYTN